MATEAVFAFQVKQIMEEAVARKFVHKDSSHIISFCVVLHPRNGLHVLSLLYLWLPRRNQIHGLQENVRRLPKLPSLSPLAIKHLWIHTALFEKVLDKIVRYLVVNSSKYYEKEALLMDPVDGPILASLLVGPCALEYTKMKTADHFWTDPLTDELVQRHRIHSSHLRQDSPTKRPALCKRHSSGSMDDWPSLSACDYVKSLHQNSRATLLYGKNNVLVQPRDDMEAVPGYLSLHQTADVMTLKWTPNQLMNGSVEDLDYEKRDYSKGHRERRAVTEPQPGPASSDCDVESFRSGMSEEEDCPGLHVNTTEHYFEYVEDSEEPINNLHVLKLTEKLQQ
ncbi:Small G Protein Signaling Modulator 1 [Manis pentadactyla]|nr:Small G Protein Signaling Modulator 1 [Manis pentadactyla]